MYMEVRGYYNLSTPFWEFQNRKLLSVFVDEGKAFYSLLGVS